MATKKILTDINLEGKIDVDGNVQATGTFIGDGSTLTNLNASNIATGTLPLGVIPEFLEEKYIYNSNDSNGVYMPMVKGGMYTTTTNQSGAIKVTLPSYRSSMMFTIYVDIYEYTTGETVTLRVSGYAYSDTGATWHNCSVVNIADSTDRNYTVRFYSDTANSDQYFTIGETTSTWSYPQVNLRDFWGGFSTSEAEAKGTWGISFVTSFTGDLRHVFTDNFAASDWDGIRDKPSFAPTNAEANVQSDWNATSGDAFIQNKPTIPTNNDELTNGAGYLTSSSTQSKYLRSDADDTATGSLRFTNGLNYFGSTDSNTAEIVMNTANNGSPQISFTDNQGDMSWSIGGDDQDNNFKIHGFESGVLPTISNLASPLFEITTGGDCLINGGSAWTSTNLTDNNQLANGAGYITDGNTGWTNTYGYITDSNDRNYITDSRGSQRAPSYYDDRYAQWDFQNSSDTLGGGDAWHGILTVSKWSNFNATHRQEQLLFTGDDLKRRTATSDSAWGDVKTIYDSGNLSLATLGYTGATNANNYTHPSYNGDDINLDTGVLGLADVISDLNIVVTTDTSGHVSLAGASYSTRTMTLANLGYTGATNANYITNNNQLTNGAGYTTFTANQSLDTTSSPTFSNLYVADHIYHTGDTNTYMQFHAADQWRVVAGGVERLEVNSSQVTVNNNLNVTGSIYAAQYIYHTNDTNTYMRFPSNDTISWNTAGSERMRINSSGNIGIGTTAPSYKLHVAGTTYANGSTIGSSDLLLQDTSSAYSTELKMQNNTHTLGIDYQNNEQIRFITRSGTTTVPITFQMRAGTITAANFILSSDERKKTKIEDLKGDALDVQWRSFEMKDNEGEYRTGVIAQELEQKHPEFVNTDDEGYKTVKYIDLLIAKVAELEARLEKVESNGCKKCK